MSYITIILQFGPMLWALVEAIEAKMPASPGKVKLDAAIAFVNSVEPTLVDAVPAVTKIIGGIVAANNAAGLFNKSASITPAA
jgi:hypothetical protein